MEDEGSENQISLYNEEKRKQFIYNTLSNRLNDFYPNKIFFDISLVKHSITVIDYIINKLKYCPQNYYDRLSGDCRKNIKE